jgi:RND superfamily putative drug exporter
VAVTRLASRHPGVALVVACLFVFGAASGLRKTAVANEVILGLPSTTTVHRAYDVAQRGFAPGVLAPVLVVVTARGVGASTTALDRLQHALHGQPGVAAVLGPLHPPTGGGLGLWRTPNAARYVLFWRTNPLGSRAIAQVRGLKHHLPTLLASVGLPSAHGMVGGDMALSADIVDATLTSLKRVVPAILGIILVVIAVFLRALVAPLYLVLTSVLAAAAALGLSTYVVQDLAGFDHTTYYVIFTVVVLLISLGSDYNVFLVGRIWQAGRRLSLREAVGEAGARASRPIATAAIVLALSFVLLVIVPVRAFREIAFAMAAGLVIDAFIVRAILVPALLVLVGPVSAWPDNALAVARRRSIDVAPAPAPGAGRGAAPG